MGSTEYKRGSRAIARGQWQASPRIIAYKPFGGAEEAPSLTVTVRDGDGNMRSGRKNARGAGRTKNEATKHDKNGVMHP